jgi:hypothetical protein
MIEKRKKAVRIGGRGARGKGGETRKLRFYALDPDCLPY